MQEKAAVPHAARRAFGEWRKHAGVAQKPSIEGIPEDESSDFRKAIQQRRMSALEEVEKGLREVTFPPIELKSLACICSGEQAVAHGPTFRERKCGEHALSERPSPAQAHRPLQFGGTRHVRAPGNSRQLQKG